MNVSKGINPEWKIRVVTGEFSMWKGYSYILKYKKENEISLSSQKSGKKVENSLEASVITNGISFHTSRHCFATYSLEEGFDPIFIQQLLGHKICENHTKIFTNDFQEYDGNKKST